MRKADMAKEAGAILLEDEVHFLEDLREFIEFGLRKGLLLPAILSVIAHDIDGLARDRFDLDKTSKRKDFHSKISGFSNNHVEVPAWIERSKQLGSGSLSKDEAAFLRDLQGFIDYGIRNEIPFLSLMTSIAHDIHELQRDGFDFPEAVKKRGFQPKASGYSKVTPESWEDVSEE